MISVCPSTPLLAQRINSYLIETLKQTRTCERVGCFWAGIDPHDANPYRNYAVPQPGGSFVYGDVEALDAWFYARKRTPRLEFVPEGAPDVENVLGDAGYIPERRAALLATCARFVRPQTSPLFRLESPVTREDFLALANAQNEAYGGEPATYADVARLRKNVQNGGFAISAVWEETGNVVGGGIVTPPHHSCAEIAGVGVVPNFARNGIGSAVAAALASLALRPGTVTPFLMAETASEQRIYERVGFEQFGSILHISRKPQV